MSSIKTARSTLRRWHRKLVFNRALAQTRRYLAGNGELPANLMTRLSYGWSNEGWAAKPLLLEYLLREYRGFRGRALECGSGLSTLLFALNGTLTGARTVSLEHHEEWYQMLQNVLRRLDLESGDLLLAPLTSYDGFDWYSEHPLLSRHQPFDLVLCDGPPNSTPGGRYGLLPRMRERLAPGAVIIVDDSHRAEEAQMIQRWLSEFPGQLSVEATHDTFTTLRFHHQ